MLERAGETCLGLYPGGLVKRLEQKMVDKAYLLNPETQDLTTKERSPKV